MVKKLNIFRLENGYLLLVDRAQKATGGGGRGMKQHCSLIWERCHAGSRPFAGVLAKFRNVYRWSARYKAKTVIKEETPGITLIKSDSKEEKAKIQAT